MKNIIIIISAGIKSARLSVKLLKNVNDRPLIYCIWKKCSLVITVTNILVFIDIKKVDGNHKMGVTTIINSKDE